MHSTEEEVTYVKTDEGWINFRLNSLGLIVCDARDRVNEVRIKYKNKSHAYS